MRHISSLLVSSLLVLAATLAAATPAAARDIFVDNTAGNDRFAGERPQVTAESSGPLRTIARALCVADAADRIVLAKTDQPYRESISLVGARHSGSPMQPFVIDGHGAILDGSALVPVEAWQHYRGNVFRFRPSHAGYQQLFLEDRPAVRVPVGRLAGGPPQLEPRQWCLVDGEIYFCVEPTKLPRDYALTYAQGETGITLYYVSDVGILDITVQGFRVDGISAPNSARNIIFRGVTCRGNGRSGITVGGASIAEVEACLLGNNGYAQLLTLPWSETHVGNSRLLSNTAPAWIDQGGQMFVDHQRVEGGIDQDRLPAPDAARP
jgi:hypothetical protein